MTGDGVNDIIVARDNGLVQIFSLGEGNDATGRTNPDKMMFSTPQEQWAPTLLVEHQVGESVRSLDVGVVRSPGYDELVLCTYSGRVMSLTTESLSDRAADDKYGRSKAVVGKETQVKAFRSELKDLHKQVLRESEKLDKLHPSKSTDKESPSFIPMENQFSVNHSFQLMEHDATYQLVMEIPIPISEVILQTTVPVDLLKQEDEATVIMCRTQSVSVGADGDSSPQVLATYRPTEKNTRRMKLGLRSVEGQHGELHVYVVSDLEPKMARVLRFAIKPLSMHLRISELKSTQENKIPWNELCFTGNFSIGQAHNWLVLCLPSVPPHYGEGNMCFRNAFVGSHLLCRYRDGELVVRSDSISTMTILKQVITEVATNNNMNVKVSTDINQDSVPHFLRLLHPKLQAQFRLSKQMQLVQSMTEITSDGDNSFFDDELRYVLEHQKEIKKAFGESKRILEIMYGMVADLYIDIKQQLNGHASKSKIPKLMQLLENYNLDALIQFFNE